MSWYDDDDESTGQIIGDSLGHSECGSFGLLSKTLLLRILSLSNWWGYIKFDHQLIDSKMLKYRDFPSLAIFE